MKKYLIFSLLFISTISYGQFAIVLDKDGSTNVRLNGNSNSKIVDTLQNGHLIYCLENKGNWANIDYTKERKESNGYIYKDRYKLISTFLQIHIARKNVTSVKLKKDSIEITLTQSMFEKGKHRFKYSKEAPDQIELIDNKQYWGTDGEMPSTQYDKIILRIGHRNVSLPKRATVGLYEPSLYNAEAYFNKQNNTLYITTINSDGAGSYEVIWEVKNGIYMDRLVAYGF